MLRNLVHGALRAILWSGLLGAAIAGLVIWRTDPMFRLGAHQMATWFGVCWALAFVPCLALELAVRHLRVELGSED